MNKKIVAISITLLFLMSLIPLTAPAAASAPTSDATAIDIANAPNMPAVNLDGISIEQRTHHSAWNVGDSAIWLIYTQTGYGLAYFTLRAIGPNTEIWVQSNLKWRTGDPRPNPIILDTEIAYLLDQFENNIYPTDTTYFGNPVPRDGSNAYLPSLVGLPADYYAEGNTKNVILVETMRDTFYYDPTYPYYIAGFFTSSFNVYFDRNIISISSYQWERRIGPLGTVWIPPTTVTRPFVYEATIAHEYQHLIHNDWNPGDELFMNEGCAMYAEFLCGYGIDPSYINSYLYTPDNSLTIWGDQGDINILADYGASAMWGIYLSDHYGGAAFLSHFVQAGIPGIDGINAALVYMGYNHATFNTVFHDWRLANLIHADSPGAGIYNYKSINLNDPTYISINMYSISGLPVPSTTGTSFGNTFTILGYDTGVSRMSTYGSDYIKLTDWTRPGHIYFDGDDTTSPLPNPWSITTDGWYSGTGVDLANFLLSGNAYVDPANPTLTIVTKWGLESFWDFGFVQVSTDGGATWTSLANAYTTSDHDASAYPAIVASLPGLTDYNPDWPSWTTMSFDLTAYAGTNVMIGFRYMTDWATTYEGWWINTAIVSGTALTLAPQMITLKTYFQVTAVSVYLVDGKMLYIPNDMPIDYATNTGFAVPATMGSNYVILVVSPRMSDGTVDYTFEVAKLPYIPPGKLAKIDTGI